MKAKVIETGEIVNVTPYPTWYKENGQGPDRREWDEDELEFIYSNDNVEPKFNVGEWITNSIETVQITGYDIDYGYQVDYKGNLQHRDTDIIEKEYHLWTIADAMDGDVLVTTFDEDNMILMYRSMCTTDTINVHCCLDNKFTRANLGVFDVEDVKPATKEQHDILFEEMHKAGYVWDVEKKELKKIEENSFESDRVEKALRKAGYEWSEETHQLKKIEQKSVWCPSKKQMESLKDMLKYNIGVFDYQKFMEVNSLYDDLKKIIKTQK